MKKVLALTLAVMLLLVTVPLTASAAAPGVIGMSNDAPVLDGSRIEDFGHIVLGTDSNVLDIPILWKGFGPWVDADDITHAVLNNLRIVFTADDTKALFRDENSIVYYHYDASGNAKITLTANNIGTASGWVYVEYYDQFSPEPKTTSEWIPIKGSVIDPTINKGIEGLTGRNLANEHVKLNGSTIGRDTLENLDIAPSSVMEFALDTEFFDWNPKIANMGAAVRKATMDNEQISVKTKIRKGSKFIKSVEIENISGRAYVVLRFTDYLVSVKDEDFDLDIALAYKKVKDERTQVTVTGTISNLTSYVNGPNDSAYLGDGNVGEAESYSPNAKLDLGSGVSVFMNLPTNRRVYGRATDKRNDSDIEIMEYYPVIKKALTLVTLNIGKDNMVQLDTDQLYYVYDADGDLIGKTDEKLPLRDKYYLAAKEIEFDAVVFADAKAEGDDAVYVDNVNDNPQTGAGAMGTTPLWSGFAIIMIVGGVMMASISEERD